MFAAFPGSRHRHHNARVDPRRRGGHLRARGGRLASRADRDARGLGDAPHRARRARPTPQRPAPRCLTGPRIASIAGRAAAPAVRSKRAAARRCDRGVPGGYGGACAPPPLVACRVGSLAALDDAVGEASRDGASGARASLRVSASARGVARWDPRPARARAHDHALLGPPRPRRRRARFRASLSKGEPAGGEEMPESSTPQQPGPFAANPTALSRLLAHPPALRPPSSRRGWPSCGCAPSCSPPPSPPPGRCPASQRASARAPTAASTCA